LCGGKRAVLFGLPGGHLSLSAFGFMLHCCVCVLMRAARCALAF
jgi:hypothetical protein